MNCNACNNLAKVYVEWGSLGQSAFLCCICCEDLSKKINAAVTLQKLPPAIFRQVNDIYVQNVIKKSKQANLDDIAAMRDVI